jgi:hypothetical protein
VLYSLPNAWARVSDLPSASPPTAGHLKPDSKGLCLTGSRGGVECAVGNMSLVVSVYRIRTSKKEKARCPSHRNGPFGQRQPC